MISRGVIILTLFMINSGLCGQPVSIEQYPYQLSLHSRDSFVCGATLIDDTWAITAAHCTTGTPVSKLKVRAGSSYNDRDGQLVLVEAKFEHPEYDTKEIGNDITVLKLATPVVDKIAKPIPIATKSPQPHHLGTVSGWGVTDPHTFETADQLMAVKLKVANDNTCLNEYEGEVYNSMFCAGGGNNATSCYGDSGGPFVINGTLHGVVSWGHYCKAGTPGVYTRVSAFRRFINRVIKTHGHKS